MVIVGIGMTAAVAAIADPDIVTELGRGAGAHHAIERNESGIHVRVAVL